MFSWLKRKEDPEKALREALGKYELPSFKTAALTALDQLRKPDVALGEVANAISADPQLSVQVLHITSSAAYAMRHPAKNVAQAVTLLGRSKIEQIVLAAAVKSALPSSPVPGFDSIEFWRAAIRRASAARVFARALHPSTVSESLTAALLSDMAIPLLSHARGEEYRQVRHEWRTGGGDLSYLESQAFGFCHGTVAAWACATWSFPRNACQGHRSPPLQCVGVARGDACEHDQRSRRPRLHRTHRRTCPCALRSEDRRRGVHARRSRSRERRRRALCCVILHLPTRASGAWEAELRSRKIGKCHVRHDHGWQAATHHGHEAPDQAAAKSREHQQWVRACLGSESAKTVGVSDKE